MKQTTHTRRAVIATLAAGAALGAVPAIAAEPSAAAGVADLRAYPNFAQALSRLRARNAPGQLYVSLAGRVLCDEGFGGAAPDTLVAWASACKPTTVAAVLRLVEEGAIGLDDPVAEHVRGFEANGKAQVTIKHLMTHTAQLTGYAGPIQLGSWNETIAKIVAAPRGWGSPRGRRSEPDRPLPPPGTIPAYNPPGIWILGEVLRLKRAQPFSQAIRNDVFLPLGMADSWNGMSVRQFDAYGARILTTRAPQSTRRFSDVANPAGGALGPCRELGRFYEVMLAGGGPILSRATIDQMVAVQASDGGLWTFGLGVNINQAPERSMPAGAERLRYGRRPSPQTFGHNGATGLIAFADPTQSLVAVSLGVGADVTDALYADIQA